MKPHAAIRRFFPKLLLFVLGLLAPGRPNAQEQNGSPRFDTIKPAGATTIRIGVTGPADRFLRVDVSTNLTSWAPFKLWPPSGAARREFDDQFAPGGRRFFRAQYLEPAKARFAAWPNRGAPGDMIELTGQLFVEGRPELHQVDIGGARAEVISATSFILQVRVPARARSGLIQLSGPKGDAATTEAFLVTGEVEVEVKPPGAIAATAYDIANHLTTPRPYAPGIKMRTRLGLPLVSVAYPRDESSDAVLMVLSDGTETNLVFDARSTAESLVLLHPALNTTDPAISLAFRAAARGSAAVTSLAQRIAARYAAGQTSFEDQELQGLLGESVRGILANTSARAAMIAGSPANLRPQIERQVVGRSHRGDLEFTAIENIDDDGKALPERVFRLTPGLGPRPPFLNGADWVVVIEEVDVNPAFPNGRNDFNQRWRQPQELRFPPVIPGTRAEMSIGGSFPSERLNPIKFVSGLILDAIAGLFREDQDRLTLPNRDAIYLVRAIGGGFYDAKENAFVITELPLDRTRAVVNNLVALVMDSVGILLDKEDISVTSDKERKDRAEFLFKLSLEAAKKVPTIKGPEDVLGALPDLLKWIAIELTDKAKEAGVEKAASYAAGKAFKKIGESLTAVGGVLKVLDIAGSVLQVAQRMDTLANSSAIETAYIVVGDPFALRIRSISPTVAGPGSLVTITFAAPANLPNSFVLGVDVVQFEGVESFEGRVLQKRPGFADGDIDLVVEIPKSLPPNISGKYVVTVIARGRRGEGTINLVTKPVITAVSPLEGYAAAPNAPAGPFSGDFVRVQGANFYHTNRFLMASLGGKIEAKVVSGTLGDVTISIPEGAITSQIAVERPVAGGGVELATSESAVRVLGAPLLQSVSPVRGPVNTLIRFQLKEGRPSHNLISLLFPDGSTVTPTGADGFYQARVPVGNRTGAVRVRTPGGQSEFEFTMEGGLPVGGVIQAGGVSVIKDLRRALDFARGAATPADDDDFRFGDDGKRIDLDPPAEEGDFVTDLRGTSDVRFPVGALFADQIGLTGTFAGPATLEVNNDSISGGVIHGDFTLAGRSCVMYSTEIQGTLRVTGSDNTLNVRVRNAPGHGLVVRGHNNRITVVVENCGGDGIRIEGGELNQLTILTNQGNAGHGIVLTEGATYNSLISNPDFEVLAGGNGRDGLVLTEGAAHNRIEGAVAGNAGHGVRLDGAGVIGNLLGGTRFGTGLLTVRNGGHGAVFTNGPSSNRAGHLRILQRSPLNGALEFEPLTAISNKLHGVAVYGPGLNDLQLKSAMNHGCGLLLRDHALPPNANSPYYLETGTKPGEGNAEAGLRLEGETRHVTLIGDLAFDQDGAVLDGPAVRGNYLGGASVVWKFNTAALADSLYIRNATNNGLVSRLASSNTLHLARVEGCGGAGLTLDGGSNNTVRLSTVRTNLGPAIRLTGGANHNEVSEMADLVPQRASLLGNSHGIRISQGASENSLSRLTISRSSLNAIMLEDEGTTGNHLFDLQINRSAGDGIVLRTGASNNLFGPEAGLADAVTFADHTNTLVRITGARTSDNVFRNLTTTLGIGKATGAVVEAGASGTLFDACTFSTLTLGVVIRDLASNTTVRASTFYSVSDRAVSIENGVDSLIGGADPGGGNLFTQLLSPLGTGIEVAGAQSTRNQIINNQISACTNAGVLLRAGVRGVIVGPGNSITDSHAGVIMEGARESSVIGNTILRSRTANIRVAGGSSTNRLAQNTIKSGPIGVQIDGATSLGNRIDKNSITGHGGKGISLENGGNHKLLAPHSLEYSDGTLTGIAALASGGVVQIFRDADDEGATMIAQGTIAGSAFSVPVALNPAHIGVLYQIRATATDKAGNTSEFSSSKVLGPPAARFLFTSTRDGNQEVYLLDGPPPAKRITSHNAADHSAALGGSTIALVSDRTGNQEIFAVSTAGVILRQLTTNSVPDYDPVWTPDQSLIVFVSERDGNAEIYSMRFNGAQPTRITTDAASDRWPTISPDGNRIAFASNRGGKYGLYTMKRDGTGVEAVPQTGLGDTQPAWSGDGTRLAFVSERDGNPEIYMIQVDGTNLRRVTSSAARDLHPSWLPGDEKLVFSSDRWGSFALTLTALTSGEPTRLTLNTGDDTEPTAMK